MLHFLEYVVNRKIEKKKLDKIGNYTIFIVNAAQIRDVSQADDEFNDFATNLTIPKLVPKHEIWISEEVPKRERLFLIHNALAQYHAKEKGMKNWYDYAIKLERAERKKVDGLKYHPEKHHEKPPDKVYYKYYCGIPSPKDDIEVWLVNGRVVRETQKVDWVLGGSGVCYDFIPAQEIWIDKDLLKDKEVDICILHEYIESTCMRYKNMPYDKAHIIAAKVDWHMRKKKWDITDVQALNREEALKMAKKYM